MIPDEIQKLVEAEKRVAQQEVFLKSLKGISVSRVATLAGSTYEKMRNAIELEQDHLLRRRAIQRILSRIGVLKGGDPVDKAEDLLKEIVWGKYIEKNAVPEIKIEEIGKVIHNYQLLAGRYFNLFSRKLSNASAKDLYEILSFEIERKLVPYDDKDALINLQYKFLAPVGLTRQRDLPEKYEGVQAYIAVMRSVTKYDNAMIKYHMFQNAFPFWRQGRKEDIDIIVKRLDSTLSEIKKQINFELKNKKYKEFVRQSIPLKILNTVITENLNQAPEVLSDKEKRDDEIRLVCEREYQQTKKRIRTTTLKMIIYLAFTKVLFILPIERIVLGHVDTIPFVINIAVPLLLMAFIPMSFRIPEGRNTQGIIEMTDRYMDPSSQKYSGKGISRERKRPFLHLIFKLFSNLVFLSVLGLITYFLRTQVNYSYPAIGVFILFLSLVSFGALGVRKIASELVVVPLRSSIFAPLIDTIATPILGLGKRLSEGASQFSPLPLIFDYMIESPFKGFIWLFEEWNTYVKEQREEII